MYNNLKNLERGRARRLVGRPSLRYGRRFAPRLRSASCALLSVSPSRTAGRTTSSRTPVAALRAGLLVPVWLCCAGSPWGVCDRCYFTLFPLLYTLWLIFGHFTRFWSLYTFWFIFGHFTVPLQ